MLEISVEEKQKNIKNYIKRSCVKDGSMQGVHTPFFLCKEILLKTNEYLKLDNENISILVIFNIEFLWVLIEELGINANNITFMSDSDQRNIFAEKRWGVKSIKNVIKKGENIMGKKFDFVIGNPPYNAPKTRKIKTKKGVCGSNLWDKFAMLSIDQFCIKDGYVVLIHPGQWRKPDQLLLDIIKKKNLLYLEMHNLKDGKDIFKVNTGYDWYILQKSDYQGETTIIDMDEKEFIINLNEWDFIPNCDFKLIKNILVKESEKKCEVVYNRTNYGHDKKWMNKERIGKFKYPCIYSITQKKGIEYYYSWTKNNGHFNIPKVVIHFIGSYVDAFVDYKGEYGLCEFCCGIKIKSEEEGKQIKEAIKSEKFKRVWKATEWMYNNQEWRTFKYFKKDFWKEFI